MVEVTKNFLNLFQFVDPYRFNWTLLERDFCTANKVPTRYLIVMYTAINGFKRREAYRRMYGDLYLQKVGKNIFVIWLFFRNNFIYN